jgi:hypothetical protein
MKRTGHKNLLIQAAVLTAVCASSCTTTTTTTTREYRAKAEKPQGFFGRIADAITERECNVMRFTCPYGWGPADEPCDCTDPKGVVLKGTTIK